MNRSAQISRLIKELCNELKATTTYPSLEEIKELGLAIHGAMIMADYLELNWMPVTFEDVACSIPNAIECASVDEVQQESEHESMVRIARMNGGM